MYRKIDFDRLNFQNGKPVPLDNPSYPYLTHEQETIKALSPELQAERRAAIDKFIRVSWIYKQYGQGVENNELRIKLLKEARKNG